MGPMNSGGSGIRVEQWSAADAQTQTQKSAEIQKTVGPPSLLETLRAAAGSAEAKVNQ